jgi:aldose 1-epimerase
VPTDDADNETITIGRSPGVEVEVLPYGATLQRMSVTGGDGERRDVLAGLARETERRSSTAHLGFTAGRYANRMKEGRLDITERPVPPTATICIRRRAARPSQS